MKQKELFVCNVCMYLFYSLKWDPSNTSDKLYSFQLLVPRCRSIFVTFTVYLELVRPATHRFRSETRISSLVLTRNVLRWTVFDGRFFSAFPVSWSLQGALHYSSSPNHALWVVTDVICQGSIPRLLNFTISSLKRRCNLLICRVSSY